MAEPVRQQVSAAVRAVLASAAAYLALVTRTNPLGSADQLLGRPDVDAVLLQALAEARTTARAAVQQAWEAADGPPGEPVLASLLADVDRAYDALAHLRGLIRHAHASVPQRHFVPGRSIPGTHPSGEAAVERAAAVRDAILGFGRQVALRNRMSVSVAAGAAHTAAVLARGRARRARGEKVLKRWVASMDGRDPRSCYWCRRLHGVAIGLDESFLSYLGGPVDLTGHGHLTQPPRPYRGDLQGPPLHPECLLPGTRVVVPGYVAHRLSLDLLAGTSGPGRDPGQLPAPAVTVTVGDLRRRGLRAVTERDYVGDVIVLRTARGYELSVTPNHPIATGTGWAEAASLKAGDHVLSSVGGCWSGEGPAVIGPHEHDIPAPVEQIAQALPVMLLPVPAAAEDFHGDGAGSEVYVVRTFSDLVTDADSGSGEQAGELKFSGGDVPGVSSGAFDADGTPHAELLGSGHAPDCRMRSCSELLALSGGEFPHPGSHGLAAPASRDSELAQPADAEGFCERLLADSAGIALDEIVQVERYLAHAKVYNLSTVQGWYLAEGIVTHNCRCHLVLVRESQAERGQQIRPAGTSHPRGSGQAAMFVTAAQVRALPEPRYQALVAFLRAALHELGQVLARLLGSFRRTT